MSTSRLLSGNGGCGISTPYTLFATLIVALLSLSDFASANPLQVSRKSALTARTAWKPSAGTTWDYQLTGTIDVQSTNVDVWDIDLFDATFSTIDGIHAKGKHVICYFSAGTSEDWRPDAAKFQASDKGSAVKGWKGENWLQTKSSNVRNVMLARLDMAAQKKCDGVEPDNVDGYDNGNGLGLTENDAVDYVTFLAHAAHSRNMAVGLKNSGSIVSRLVSKVDYSVQEQCVQHGNCAEFHPFIEQNKPVFHVEYSNGGVPKREVPTKDDSNAADSNEDASSGKAYRNKGASAVSDAIDSNSDAPSTAEVAPTSSTGTSSPADSSASDSNAGDSIGANPAAQAASSNKANSAAIGSSSVCSAEVAGFSSIIKNLDLGAWVKLCR